MSRRKLFEDLEKQREDRDKSIEKKLGAIRSRKRKAKKDRKPTKKAKTARVQPTITDVVLPRSRTKEILRASDLLLDRNENQKLTAVKPAQDYASLAALFTKAHDEQGIYLGLAWPNSFAWVGLSHALSSRFLSRASLGDSFSRMVIYPSMSSDYENYRRTRIDQAGFLDEARQAAERSMDLSRRHLCFMHLNQVAEDEEPRKHPAISNSISVFNWDKGSGNWKLFGDGFFSDVRLALHHHEGRTRDHKDQIAVYAREMADPENSHDTIFRVPRSLSPTQAKKLILGKGEHTDITVIDARIGVISIHKSWRSSLESIVDKFYSQDNLSSLIVITDSPSLYEFLQLKLKKLQRQTGKSATKKQVYKHEWLKVEDDFWKSHTGHQLVDRRGKIRVEVTEAKAIFAVSKITTLANSIEGDNPQLAAEFRRAGGFLKRVVNLPVGQRVIGNWLNETTANWNEASANQLAVRFSWKHYILQLKSRSQSQGSFDESALVKLEEIADGVVIDNYDSTSAGKSLLKVAKDKLSEGRTVTLVVPDRVSERFVCADLRSHFRESVFDRLTVLTGAYEADGKPTDVLIIAGQKPKNILQILFSKIQPTSFYLIIDAHSADKLQKELSIVIGYSEFSPVAHWLQELATELGQQVGSFLKIGGDANFPTDLPEYTESTIHGNHLSDPYAKISLEGLGVLPVGENTTLIKYDSSITPPYLAVSPDAVSYGDYILSLEEEDKEEIAEVFQLQASRLSSRAEIALRSYFDIANQCIEEIYTQSSRIERARAILAEMKALDSELAESVNESQVTRWVKHIEDFADENEGPMGEIRSNSPRYRNTFLLFANALGLDQVMAAQFWQKGIYQLRVAHILKGQRLGKRVRQILIGVIRLDSLEIDENSLARIWEIAAKSTFRVDAVVRSEDEIQDE